VVDLDDMDIDPDAKQVMEDVADEIGVDISKLQIPQNKLEALFDAFSEEEFREAMEQALKQIQ